MALSVKQMLKDSLLKVGFQPEEADAALGSWISLRESMKDFSDRLASIIFISHKVHGNPLNEAQSCIALRKCKELLKPLLGQSRGDTPDPPDEIPALSHSAKYEYTSPDTETVPDEIVGQAHRYSEKVKSKRKTTVTAKVPKVNIL